MSVALIAMRVNITTKIDDAKGLSERQSIAGSPVYIVEIRLHLLESYRLPPRDAPRRIGSCLTQTEQGDQYLSYNSDKALRLDEPGQGWCIVFNSSKIEGSILKVCIHSISAIGIAAYFSEGLGS